MRTIWTILSVVAVANLLGFGAFLGWLGATGRLNGERVGEIREMLRETVAEQKAREQKEAEAAEAARLAAEEEARKKEAPLSASESLQIAGQSDELRRQALERMRRESEDLRRTLSRERDEVDKALARLGEERAAFDEMRKRIAEQEGSEQFEKALRLYESLKPDQAKAAMQALIDKGEIEQVVSYLNAMQARSATKVLAEFTDPMVAADLLERLRTRGLEARSAKEMTSGANPG
ncbi:MAG: hypothetical protein AB7G17_05740 [Phycisphaerales bacterium]